MIYLTSDLHFNHSREFIYKPRGFNSVEEMNNTHIAVNSYLLSSLLKPHSEAQEKTELIDKPYRASRKTMEEINPLIAKLKSISEHFSSSLEVIKKNKENSKKNVTVNNLLFDFSIFFISSAIPDIKRLITIVIIVLKDSWKGF